MTQPQDTERAAFEAWARREGFDLNEPYINHTAWSAWQARAAAECCEGMGTCTRVCSWGRGFQAGRAALAASPAPTKQPEQPSYLTSAAAEGRMGEALLDILRNPAVLKTPDGYDDDTGTKWAWFAHGNDTSMEPFYSRAQVLAASHVRPQTPQAPIQSESALPASVQEVPRG